LLDNFVDDPPPANRLGPADAAAAALAWASAAGRAGDLERVHRLFAELDGGIFGGERAIGQLLDGLGFKST
jgi:hypothetical protein